MDHRPRQRSRSGSASRSFSFGRTRSNQGSRAASPSATNRRVAKLNLYLSNRTLHRRNSIVGKEDAPAPMYANGRLVKIWDGQRQSWEQWDNLRRDPELWLDDGDCFVHLCERGTSLRGPSLRVYLADILDSGFGRILDTHEITSQTSSPASSLGSMETYSDTQEQTADRDSTMLHHLYISAPRACSREDALHYHVTTRNFFAMLYSVAIVGDRLGHALTTLYDRLREYCESGTDFKTELLQYLDQLEYTRLPDSPDQALAVLQLAERMRHRDLWIDAFAHCVGMNERLDDSDELVNTSKASQALITRARIEMHIRLDRAGTALGSFLEDEIPGPYMNLSKDARSHIEHFRSFLHSHYVRQYGYWPPARPSVDEDALPKHVYETMHFDFRTLYNYLADQSFGDDLRPSDSGICVSQNILAFDARSKYPPLPYPLPLVPKIPERVSKQWFRRRQDRLAKRLGACCALIGATNSHDSSIMNNELVREYLEYEKDWVMKSESGISCADARRVRWILIYALLQVLASVTRVPDQVRDVEGVEYSLCCQTAGTPPWSSEVERGSQQERLSVQKTDSEPLLHVSAPPSAAPAVNAKDRPPLTTRRSSFIQRVSLNPVRLSRSNSMEFVARSYSDYGGLGADSPIGRKSFSQSNLELSSVAPWTKLAISSSYELSANATPTDSSPSTPNDLDGRPAAFYDDSTPLPTTPTVSTTCTSDNAPVQSASGRTSRSSKLRLPQLVKPLHTPGSRIVTPTATTRTTTPPITATTGSKSSFARLQHTSSSSTTASARSAWHRHGFVRTAAAARSSSPSAASSGNTPPSTPATPTSTCFVPGIKPETRAKWDVWNVPVPTSASEFLPAPTTVTTFLPSRSPPGIPSRNDFLRNKPLVVPAELKAYLASDSNNTLVSRRHSRLKALTQHVAGQRMGDDPQDVQHENAEVQQEEQPDEGEEEGSLYSIGHRSDDEHGIHDKSNDGDDEDEDGASSQIDPTLRGFDRQAQADMQEQKPLQDMQQDAKPERYEHLYITRPNTPSQRYSLGVDGFAGPGAGTGGQGVVMPISLRRISNVA